MSAEDVVREIARQADRTVRLLDKPGQQTLLAMLAILLEADQRHIAQLLRLIKVLGPDSTFTAASAVAYRPIGTSSVRWALSKFLRLLGSSSVLTMVTALKRQAELVTSLDAVYDVKRGPRRLTQAAMMASAVRGTKSSLLIQHQASVESYGRQMIGQMEKTMRVGMVQGRTQFDMVGEMTQFTDQRWRAWRVVRSEHANAYNAVTQATLEEEHREGEPTLKKILAHFDNRTAPDSIYVHGQIRPVAGLFMDGAGRRYLHPPARPHDRETVIPWYADDWEEDDFSKHRPPRERAQAKLEMMPYKYRPKGARRVAFLASTARELAATPDL